MKKLAWAKYCSLFLIFILSLYTGCEKKEKEVIRLNEVVRSIFYAPQYVAIEKGFFADEGLEIELDIGWGADKSMTALVSNNADIALMGAEASIYVYNQGKDDYIVNFALLTQRAGNFLVSREPEPDFKWEDVRGRSIIGGRPGGMPQMVLEYILKQNNIAPFEDVEILTNLQFTSTAGAFVGGIGDYTVEFEPAASAIEAEGAGYVVASLGTDSGKVPYTAYAATQTYMKKHPDRIQRFTNAIYKGLQWVSEHEPEEIAKVIQPHFEETDLDMITKIVKRYKEQDSWSITPVFEKESLDLLQDVLEMSGELDQRVPYEDLVNTDFARKALK
ncbi:MAG: ABC transporter substrate-binding protein [Epulopiscium sp.]|nr:ABC transporter substrate-binding protein [Candidatus Epulonipiscium sp.]